MYVNCGGKNDLTAADIREIKHHVCFTRERQNSHFCRLQVKVSSFAFVVNVWIIFDFSDGFILWFEEK